MIIVYINVKLQNLKKDILAGTALNYVVDVIKHLIVHHVIISTAVMSHWKRQVIKDDEIRLDTK